MWRLALLGVILRAVAALAAGPTASLRGGITLAVRQEKQR